MKTENLNRNRIPRNFYCISGTVLVETSETAPGDPVYVTKNDYGYLALNRRNGKFFYLPASFIRDALLFEITGIRK